jgi:hypothetical protein
MRSISLVCGTCVVVGCFDPASDGDGDTTSVESTGVTTDSGGTSSSGAGPSTAADASETAAETTGMPGTTGDPSDGSDSSSSSSPTDTSTTSAESTGPSTIDPDGPYGDCDPERSCPANGPLGCANTDDGVVCLPDCDEAECPDLEGPTAPFCVGLVGGEHACVILCQDDSHCPAGLTCQSGFGNSDICAWPS